MAWFEQIQSHVYCFHVALPDENDHRLNNPPKLDWDSCPANMQSIGPGEDVRTDCETRLRTGEEVRTDCETRLRTYCKTRLRTGEEVRTDCETRLRTGEVRTDYETQLRTREEVRTDYEQEKTHGP